MKLFTRFSLCLAALLIALVTAALLLGKTLPAGARYSFTEINGANTDIYALDPAHGIQIDLTRNPAVDFEEAWSPNGQRMAFVSDRGGKPQLYMLTIGDGGGLRLLDTQAISPNYRPVWSLDGRSLAYEVTKPTGSDIAVVDVDQPSIPGANPRVLVPSLSPDRYPIWSPDGSEIAFTSWRSGDAEIYRVRSDGSGLINLTNSPNDDSSPDWSPDGQQIAFLSLRSDFREIYVMNRDGSNVRQVTQARQSQNGNYWGAPFWSSDGQTIAYQAVVEGDPSVVVIALDGMVKRRLMNHRFGANIDTLLLNGKRIRYLAMINARVLLYLTEADGSSPHALTPMDGASEFQGLWVDQAS